MTTAIIDPIDLIWQAHTAGAISDADMVSLQRLYREPCACGEPCIILQGGVTPTCEHCYAAQHGDTLPADRNDRPRRK